METETSRTAAAATEAAGPLAKPALYHERVAAVLRREILAEHEAGDRLAADARQAERFGVSINTVREALRLLCAEGLLERRHGSGTYVAEKQKRTTVLLSETIMQGTASFFFMQVLNELRRLLAERGHRVELHLPPHPAAAGEAEDCPSPQQLAACTAVVALADRDLAYWLPALAERAIPVVGLSQELPNAVYCDVPGMVRRGAVLPLELGRRRPALYAHEHDVPGRPSTWIGGLFREALAAAGVTVPAERLLGGHWQAQSPQGWHRLRELLARPPAVRPDSLFIADETLAGQAVVAVLESGLRVPEDLLVVSHAHRGSSTFYPFPVYRLEMPHAEVARGLVEALERLEAAPDRPLGHTVLPPRLVPPRPADAAG